MSSATDWALEAALRTARERGRAQFLVVRRALTPAEAALDPLAWLAAAPPSERFYLERPSVGNARVALGSCADVQNYGADRLTRAGALLGELDAQVHVAGDTDAQRPAWVGGFAFAPDDSPEKGSRWSAFANCRFVLPRISMTRDASGSSLSFALRVAPSDTPDAARSELARAQCEAEALAAAVRLVDWRAGAPSALRVHRPARGYRRLVAEALDAIAKGEADKLVVARALDVSGVRAPLARILCALREAQPHCATFALAHPQRGDEPAATFLGATPELLVRVSGRSVEAQALAGSAGRGRTSSQDAHACRALLASAKERSEHEVVVEALRAALAPFCDELSRPGPPRALSLPLVQHLETPLRGRLATGESARLLEIAARLHPSPAVLGAPRAAAERWLAKHEALARGWYSGAIGAVDTRGDGELFVALRCALLRGDEARLFAGAGIVGGSRPDPELRETRLKLRAVLGALKEASHARG